MVKSKKYYFGRSAADWPFGLLLRLIVLAIKNKSSENESNSFLQKNHLLFYDQVQKMLFRPIGGRLAADWPFGMLLHLFFPAIKNKCSENESNSFLQKNHLLFYGQVQKMPFRLIGGRSAVWAVTASSCFGHQKILLRK